MRNIEKHNEQQMLSHFIYFLLTPYIISDIMEKYVHKRFVDKEYRGQLVGFMLTVRLMSLID
jgi:hypothetical protein